jgi:hypothetical protein
LQEKLKSTFNVNSNPVNFELCISKAFFEKSLFFDSFRMDGKLQFLATELIDLSVT